MEVFYLDRTYKIPKLEINSCVIGNFDGLHIGHIDLINQSKENSFKSLVITFDDIHKDKIISLDDKINKIKELDVDYLIVLKFEDYKNMFHYEFVKMLKKINVKKVTIGKDFRFGYKQEGDYIDLQNKFEVKIIDDFYFEDEKVSSSLIRENLKNANILKVNKLLGYNYFINGIVEKGNQIGNTIGFPTANINYNNILKPGVYKTKTIIDELSYNSITNIGINPTINELNQLKVETHIIDFNDDIYNKEIKVEFIDFIRNEMKFNNKEELIEQLNKDKLV